MRQTEAPSLGGPLCAMTVASLTPPIIPFATRSPSEVLTELLSSQNAVSTRRQ